MALRHPSLAEQLYCALLCGTDQVSFNLSFAIVQELDWILSYHEYKNQLVDHAALMLSVTGRVNETKQVLATQFNFRLRTPDIIIKVSPQLTPILGFLLTDFTALA